MESLWIGLLLVVSLAARSSGLNSYIVTLPKTIRPGITTKVDVEILNSAGPVDVTVNLANKKNETIVSGHTQVVPKSLDVIHLEIPRNLPQDDYRLFVKGAGGLEFENSTNLDYTGKGSSIFIQTDRAMYKPGQTVNFRIFGMHPDLTVVRDQINIDIYDPKKNRIAQWRNMTSKNGVITDRMVMSDQPILGDWKIKVTQGRETKEKEITVGEYVLPRFEVNLELPPFALTKQKHVFIKVSANYTIGTPVKGTGILRIKRMYTMWWNRKRPGFTEFSEQPFKINGVKNIMVPIKEFKKIDPNLQWTEFVIDVNVTEGITGKRMNDSGELTFYKTAEKIDFVESLPNNFKPGLDYTAIVKVSQRDDSPIPYSLNRVNISISYRFPIEEKLTTPPPTTTSLPKLELPGELPEPPMPSIRRMIMPPRPFPRYRTEYLPPSFYDVPPDGLVKFDIDVPVNASSVNIRAQYKKERAYKDLEESKSPSKSFVQVRLITPDPEAERDAVFEIKSTRPVDKVNFKILSKGMIVSGGQFPMAGNMRADFPVFITADMAPSARMVVQYTLDTGEIVADGITFKIRGIFRNEVAVSFDRNNLAPGKVVDLHLRAAPFSDVFVLAVDRGTQLLKTGNDITTDDVQKELETYDNNRFGHFPGFFMWRWPIPSGGQDAEDVFRKNGLVVLTDANLFNHVEPWLYQRRVAFDAVPMMAMAAPAPMADANMMRSKSSSVSNASPKSSSKVKVRKSFPETWLWNEVTTGSRGQTHMTVKTPDTMTTWIATAFAVHPEYGLGVGPSSSKITVSLPFFVRINMPYSAVRGELLLLQVDVFNYGVATNWTLVVMEDNPTIHNLFTERGSSPRRKGEWVRVTRGRVNSAYFPMIPREVGEQKIVVKGFMEGSVKDVVEKTLLVEPEGTPQEFNNPTLIDLGTSQNFETFVPIDFPVDAVEGSTRVRASVIGDIMGPTINGIDKLLKMPYGCGEQNMLNFAPNIFVRQYLEVTKKLTKASEAKAKNYMVKGYQRELTYQHKDGSFSAFGESDKSGTTWLTAFVVKSFSQASKYITIDEENMIKAVKWLTEQQNDNGTFREPGKVLHKAMQGGSAAGDNALTAFVMIALVEAQIFEETRNLSSEAVLKSQQFLESEVDSFNAPNAETDMYELAIISYALSLVKSKKLPEVLAMLDNVATKKDGTMYWNRPSEENTEDSYISWRPSHIQANAINIELTSYVLLAFASMENTNEGISILRWLTAQRNPEGGFSSTQDTVVALQALAEMAGLIYSPNLAMNIELIGKDRFGSDVFRHIFDINPGNALVLQSVDIPDVVKNVQIRANGQGMALVEVATYFNTMDDLQKKAFGADVTVIDETKAGYSLKVCGRWLKKGTSAMALMQIGFPTGVEPDISTLDTVKAPNFKRAEITDRGLIIYLDEIGPKPECIRVEMTRVRSVGLQKPVPVKIYDYYDTSKQTTTFYTSTLSQSDMCEMCRGGKCYCRRNVQ